MCIRGEKTYKELSLKDLYESRMIKEFTKHDIVITGGEPTLCNDFIPIVNFLKNKVNSLSLFVQMALQTSISIKILKNRI